MRVHQLAKEYDKKSSDFLTEIQGYGINVFSHLSGLSDDEVATIRQKIETKEVAIKLEHEVLERQTEKKDDWTLGSGDVVVEGDKIGIDTEKIQEALATNIEAAGEAREEYAKTTKAIAEDPENWHVLDPKTEDTELSFGQKAFAKAEETTKEGATEIQEVEVEKSTGFFGWLKGLFS